METTADDQVPVPAAVVDDGDAELNKQRTQWGTDEQALLISLVLEDEKTLFGAAKGDGGDGNINAIKRRAWQAIADQLNAQFITKKRSWQECKKKWNNSKQRAKQKIDNLRHPRTGGGPAQPQITPTEELILQGIGGRPSMTGVGSFLDTDAATPEISFEQDLEEANTSHEFSRSTPVTSGSNTTNTNPSVEKRKALKRKSTQDIEELTQKNLLLDNEMLIEQNKMYVKKQEKYNIEIQKMKLEIEYWALKKELLVLQI
ncbi:myb-related transcription factor, partner of profilin-like [Mytilus edulis]|uniref:myb-related transcription factor, partner of profilin-like n=1 Tax=Mytilus edulis TaxID=6550 RepID=UPI0039EE2866